MLILVLCTACGPQHPQIAPIPVHAIPVGIVDGFHALANFATDCPAMIRTPQVSAEGVRAFLTAIPEGCPVLVLVEAPDLALVKALLPEIGGAAIELGNELELPPFELTPEQYGDWIGRAIDALVDGGYRGTIVLGGVYAVTPETKRAILLGIAACLERGVPCVAAVHLYDASDEDLAWLRWLTRTYGWLRVWVTEVGFPTRCDPARLPMQKDFLETQIARFSTVDRLERVFIYQRGDGPIGDCSDLGTFGIDGKPAADLPRK